MITVSAATRDTPGPAWVVMYFEETG